MDFPVARIHEEERKRLVQYPTSPMGRKISSGESKDNLCIMLLRSTPRIFLLKTMYGKLSACVAFAMAVKNRSPVQGTTVGCDWVGPISHPTLPSVRFPKRIISESSRFKHRSSSNSYRYVSISPFPFHLHYYRILLWEIRTRK